MYFVTDYCTQVYFSDKSTSEIREVGLYAELTYSHNYLQFCQKYRMLPDNAAVLATWYVRCYACYSTSCVLLHCSTLEFGTVSLLSPHEHLRPLWTSMLPTVAPAVALFKHDGIQFADSHCTATLLQNVRNVHCAKCITRLAQLVCAVFLKLKITMPIQPICLGNKWGVVGEALVTSQDVGAPGTYCNQFT